jgi:hypothetical protein
LFDFIYLRFVSLAALDALGFHPAVRRANKP